MKKCSKSVHHSVTELNITPLLDLAFVLLVIFIITTIPPVKDLDLNARTATIRNTKERGQHKGKRKAHLPAMLVAALANMPREEGRPLFWYRTLKVVAWPWDPARPVRPTR